LITDAMVYCFMMTCNILIVEYKIFLCPLQKRGHVPRPAGDHLSLATAQAAVLPIFLQLFFNFLNFFFGKFGKWARPFGRMGIQHPHFLKLALTLGSVKCSICHGDWRFHFFSNFIFPEFRVYLDL
jgi:hypothetical protein